MIDDHDSLGFSPPSCEMWGKFVAYHFLRINITVLKVFKPCHGSTFESKNEKFSLYMSFCLVIIQHGIYMSDIFVWVPIIVVWLQLGRFLEEIQNEVVGNFLIERSLGVSDESYPERRSYASCKSDEESMVSFHKCGSERSYYSPFICTVKRRISLGTTWRHLVLGSLRLCLSRSEIVCYVPYNDNLLASLSDINLCWYLCRNFSFITLTM